MKVLVISPGKAHDRTVKEGVAEYEKRLSRHFSLAWAFPSASTKESEAAAILKLLKSADFVILLDESGRDIDTPAFSKLVDQKLQSGVKRLVFVIGGAFGVDAPVRVRADLTLRLSSLVFPHMLVRLILVEQLYRAVSIMSGGKYHHA
jgi:23S rRNA (pseudouridine1915-N3)-methyltransferase